MNQAAGAQWRVAHAAVAGTSHLRAGTPCQDAGRCDVLSVVDAEVLVASVADGAGSASRAEDGARHVVDRFQAVFGAAARDAPDLDWLDRAFAVRWLATVQAELVGLAAERGCAPADFACTILGTVIAGDTAAFMQIGDGAIVAGRPGSLAWVFWPQHGEYANSTYFVTMPEAGTLLQFVRQDAPTEVALFSDGLERLILDMRAQTVHSPSLRPILDWLATTHPGRDGGPSPVLAAYLDGANVNRRTDDDKTLVVATRVAPP